MQGRSRPISEVLIPVRILADTLESPHKNVEHYYNGLHVEIVAIV